MARRRSLFRTPSLKRAFGISSAKSRLTRMTGGQMLRNPSRTIRQKAHRYGSVRYWLTRGGGRRSRAKSHGVQKVPDAGSGKFATVLTLIVALITGPFLYSFGWVFVAMLAGIWFMLYVMSAPSVPIDRERIHDVSPEITVQSDKPKRSAPSIDEILKIHFDLQGVIQETYKERDNPEFLQLAIQACYDQIAFAPTALEAFKAAPHFREIPRHIGYEQLCIIREKQGQYDEVIQLSNQAKAQGWNGSWDARIERCTKKLKQKSP